jgi:ketosteroid isomerase-like protein
MMGLHEDCPCNPRADVEAGGAGLTETANRQVAERLFQALIDQDLEGFHRRFHEDSVIEFPQSGERIVGSERRRAVYQSFPGRPGVRRLLTGGPLAVVEATVDYGDGVDWHAVFILELRDAKIAKLTAYWAQPFAPAESRAASVEPIDGREPG